MKACFEETPPLPPHSMRLLVAPSDEEDSCGEEKRCLREEENGGIWTDNLLYLKGHITNLG
jgi:hypothetical protein